MRGGGGLAQWVNGRGKTDLRPQCRDHEGPRIEHGAGAERAPLMLGSWAPDDDAVGPTQPEQGGRQPPWTPCKRQAVLPERPSREPEGTKRGTYRRPSVLRLGQGLGTGAAVPVRLYQAAVRARRARQMLPRCCQPAAPYSVRTRDALSPVACAQGQAPPSTRTAARGTGPRDCCRATL